MLLSTARFCDICQLQPSTLLRRGTQAYVMINELPISVMTVRVNILNIMNLGLTELFLI